MPLLSELLAANEHHALSFSQADLPRLPTRKLAILTCMDSRIFPYKMLGLNEGDAHVIRNAGARVTPDVIRSLIISHNVLGTREIVIIHHTECGMQRMTNDALRMGLHKTYGLEPEELDFLLFTDQPQTLRDDIATLRASPFIPDWIPVAGLIYDVKTGRLEQVV